MQNIKSLKAECLKFEVGYEEEGPTVGASEPKLALSRLINFRAIYDALNGRICTERTKLFGLNFHPTNFYDMGK